jgi:hypothetical protein
MPADISLKQLPPPDFYLFATAETKDHRPDTTVDI